MLNIAQSVVEELQHVLASPFKVRGLQGGVVNSSFHLVTADREYFLKVFDAESSTTLNRQQQFTQQQQLAQWHIAPKPFLLAASGRFQLDEWIDLPSLQLSEKSSQNKCLQLAKTLARIHQLPLTLSPLSLDRDWQLYWQLAGKPYDAQEQLEQQRLLAIWREACQSHSVLCHNDLAFAHITDGQLSVVFDWEYAATGSPFFDIASSLKVNQLSPAEVQIVMNGYAQEMQLEQQWLSQRVSDLIPVVDKTYALWTEAFSHKADDRNKTIAE